MDSSSTSSPAPLSPKQQQIESEKLITELVEAFAKREDDEAGNLLFRFLRRHSHSYEASIRLARRLISADRPDIALMLCNYLDDIALHAGRSETWQVIEEALLIGGSPQQAGRASRVFQRRRQKEAQIKQAEACLHESKIKGAMAIVENAVAKYPDDSHIRSLLAHVAHLAEKYDVAIRQCQWLIHRYPQDPTFHQQLAKSAFASGDFPQASQAFNRANTLLRDSAENCKPVKLVEARWQTLEELSHTKSVSAWEAGHNRHVYEIENATLYGDEGLIFRNGELVIQSEHHRPDHHPARASAYTGCSRSPNWTLIQLPQTSLECIFERAILLSGPGCSDSLCWITEFLPQLQQLLSVSRYRFAPILISEQISAQDVELLQFLVGPKRTLIYLSPQSHLFIGQMLVCSPSATGMNLSEEQANPEQESRTIDSSAIAWLQKSLRRNQASKKRTSDGPRRVFMQSDAKASKNQCVNEDQVAERFQTAGYSLAIPDQLSLEQRLELFANAEEIAGFAGDDITYLLLAASNVKFICLAPPSPSLGHKISTLYQSTSNRQDGLQIIEGQRLDHPLQTSNELADIKYWVDPEQIEKVLAQNNIEDFQTNEPQAANDPGLPRRSDHSHNAVRKLGSAA